MFNPFLGLKMKTWIKRTLIGVFGATALIGGLAACSHRPHAPWAMAGMSEADQAKWRERMVERAGSKLDLDAAQKAKLSVLADTLAAQRKQVMGTGTDPRAEFQALLAGERLARLRFRCRADRLGRPGPGRHARRAAGRLHRAGRRPRPGCAGPDLLQQQAGREWSCSSCHGVSPTQEGKHASTGKAIRPLAPAFNPERFTDTAKTEKWFRRNCNDVVGRECTPTEKADVLAWLLTLK